MTERLRYLADKFAECHHLEKEEYVYLIRNRTSALAEYLAALARETRHRVYGNAVYIRGLIEISNICKNDCLYCGIRKSNRHCERYRLTPDEIIECCREGYVLGFRTFVLQGGEDAYYSDELLCALIKRIKTEFQDCALTLSLGERSRESYEKLKLAGADRYLLRHETASREHYSKLHPENMSYDNRMRCLYDLKELSYQVGCGFMVGSPYQTYEDIAQDLCFIERFKPDMCGIGPFIPQSDTPFGNESAGTLELTCFLLSVIRLIRPNILLPSTTALGSIHPNGREMGILAGANVVMPNLSPTSVRKKYALYNNKAVDGSESAECKASLVERMNGIGYKVVTDRGDVKKL